MSYKYPLDQTAGGPYSAVWKVKKVSQSKLASQCFYSDPKFSDYWLLEREGRDPDPSEGIEIIYKDAHCPVMFFDIELYLPDEGMQIHSHPLSLSHIAAASDCYSLSNTIGIYKLVCGSKLLDPQYKKSVQQTLSEMTSPNLPEHNVVEVIQSIATALEFHMNSDFDWDLVDSTKGFNTTLGTSFGVI